MFNEGKVYAVAKKPMLNREVSKDYAHHSSAWELVDLHETHGGSPVIVGLCTLDVTEASKKVPRYKVEFPDGFIDYIRLDNFDEWYDMQTL